MKTKEEKSLLKKLASGLLDGPVGRDLECGDYAKVTVGKYIKDGEPVSFREGPSSKYFDGEETVRVPGKRDEDHYSTDEEKLTFMQKYGWLIDDDDARKYSAKYKPKK